MRKAKKDEEHIKKETEEGMEMDETYKKEEAPYRKRKKDEEEDIGDEERATYPKNNGESEKDARKGKKREKELMMTRVRKERLNS